MSWFIKPKPVKQIVTEHLYETRIALLEQQRIKEHATAMVTLLSSRTSRLAKDLKTLEKEEM